MASNQKVKFGDKTIATRFYDPIPGSIEYVTIRKQPFGLKGEIELRGKQGGQSVQVPVRFVAKSYKALEDFLKPVQEAVGDHQKLVLVYNTGARRSDGEVSYGAVTLDSAPPIKPPKYLAFDTEIKGPCWECVVLLVFRKLNPDD